MRKQKTVKQPLFRGALDMFFPADQNEVSEFDRMYGSDLKIALHKNGKNKKHFI